jgi:hypothetical protein
MLVVSPYFLGNFTLSPSSQHDQVSHIQVIQVEHSGRRGRPKMSIDKGWLQEALSSRRKITLQQIADTLGIHRNTLRYHMKKHGVSQCFSQIADRDLDMLLRMYKVHKPSSGLRYVIGFLKRHGVRVQRRRVRLSLSRIDSLGRALRRHSVIQRRKYKVPRPNHLWHLDGHHKLIQWGIVIHGMTDGYCRTVII